MSEQQSTRRKFLKYLGLSAGATLATSSVMASFVDHDDIKSLNAEQQEFMVRYGKWMDEFTDAIRIKKSDPESLENNKRVMTLSEKAEKFKPELDVFMEDGVFQVIFKDAIKRVTIEI